MPRRNYRKPEIRKRITRQLEQLAVQLETFARELQAWQAKAKRRYNRKQ